MRHRSEIQGPSRSATDRMARRPVEMAAASIRALTPQPELEMIMPALNEELRIGATVTALCEQAARQPWVTRLIVVDNGSSDTTAEVVDLARRSDMAVEVIGCRTRGKGAAVRAGILHSSAPFVGYCDADLSTPPSAMVPGVELLRSGWEVVIGSRRTGGAMYIGAQPPLRRIGSLAFRIMARRLTGHLSDTQCGFKLFRQEAARALFEPSVLNGFAFDVEILARALRDQFKMIELPIQWTDQEGSTFRALTDGINAFRELRMVQHLLAEQDQGLPA